MASSTLRTDASETPLRIAASLGDFQEVCVLVTPSRSDGKTPLMLAVARNCPETVKALLHFGADLEVADKDGTSALRMAFQNAATHHLIVERFLFEVKAKEPRFEIAVEKLLDAGCTLYHAAFGGNFKLLKAFLQRGIDVDSTCFKGRTALHVAVDAADWDAVSLLLDEGANVNLVDDEGLGALCIAAAKGNAGMVRCLLDHGADPNVKAFDFELTPFIAAMEVSGKEQQYDECVEVLLEFGAVPTQKVGEHATVLDEALKHDSHDRIDWLICHVALKKMQGFDMVERMIDCKMDEHRGVLPKLKDYYEMCRGVLRMNVFRTYSLFDLLTVSEWKLRMLMRNESFMVSVDETLDEIYEMYRYYYITLFDRLDNAPGPRLEDKATTAFCKIFGRGYNGCYVIAREVVKYLDKRDLMVLGDA